MYNYKIITKIIEFSSKLKYILALFGNAKL